MTLRSQINVFIALLMGLFLAAVIALEVDATRRSIREEIEASTRITLQLLGTVVADTQGRGGNVSRQQHLTGGCRRANFLCIPPISLQRRPLCACVVC
jgi:two-component system sensor histidine kinase UhpB